MSMFCGSCLGKATKSLVARQHAGKRHAFPTSLTPFFAAAFDFVRVSSFSSVAALPFFPFFHQLTKFPLSCAPKVFVMDFGRLTI
ncbi:hypothetical protein LguiA_006584 [Lonicera macranthoides]